MTEENNLHAIENQRFVLLTAPNPNELHNRDPKEFSDPQRNAIRFQRWRTRGIEVTACGIEYNPGSDGEADGKVIVHEGDDRPRCAECSGEAPAVVDPEAANEHETLDTEPPQ